MSMTLKDLQETEAATVYAWLKEDDEEQRKSIGNWDYWKRAGGEAEAAMEFVRRLSDDQVLTFGDFGRGDAIGKEHVTEWMVYLDVIAVCADRTARRVALREQSEAGETHFIIGRCPGCGAIIASMVDMPGLIGGHGRELSDWYRSGLVIERVSDVETIRRDFRACSCAEEPSPLFERAGERCLGCGWEGTEEEKTHDGSTAMKGPGICPSCGGGEFDEIGRESQ